MEYMGITEVIKAADLLRVNDFDSVAKTEMIADIELEIQRDVMLLSSQDIKIPVWPGEYDSEKAYAVGDKVSCGNVIYENLTGETGENPVSDAVNWVKSDIYLSVPKPHSALYKHYLVALYDFYLQDYQNYANDLAMAEGHLNAFASWWIDFVNPATKTKEPVILSAYGIAVKNGFEGTEEEWLLSLKGDKGEDGKSAYEIAVEKGFKGTEEEWLKSLKNAGKDNESDLEFGNLGGIGNKVLIKGYNIHSLGNADGSSCIIFVGAPIEDLSALVGRRFNYFYREGDILVKTRGNITEFKDRSDLRNEDGDYYYYEICLDATQKANYFPTDLTLGEVCSIIGNIIISPDEKGEFPPGVIDLNDNGEIFTAAIFGINGVGYLNTLTAGLDCIAAAYCAISIGRGCFTDGEYGINLGYKSKVRKNVGVSLGQGNDIDGVSGVGIGRGLKVYSDFQQAYGQYNIPDLLRKYLIIVGNGTSDANRSNAFTLDIDGNGWVKKNFETGGNIETNDLEAKGNIASSGEITDGKDNVLSEKMDKITIDKDITKAGKGISDISTMTPVEGVTVEGSYGTYTDDKAIGYNAEKPLSVKNLYSTNPSANVPSHKHVLVDGKITDVEEVTDGYKFAYADFGVGLYNTTDPYKTIVELDLSNHENTVFSGLRVYSRKMVISGVGTAKISPANVISKAYLYVSDDGETWYRSNLISIPAGAHRYVDLPFTYGEGERINLTGIKYIRIEIIELGGSLKNYHWGSEEILLLKEVDTLPTSRAVREYIVANKELFENFKEEVSGCLVKIDSYLGTGVYGASNPTKIPCPFKPKALTIHDGKYASGSDIKEFSGDIFEAEYTKITGPKFTSTSNGNTLTNYLYYYIKYVDGIIYLYCTGTGESASYQFNKDDIRYYYRIFG